MSRDRKIDEVKLVKLKFFSTGFVTALLLMGFLAGFYFYFRPSDGERKLSTLMNPSREDKKTLVDPDDSVNLPTPTPVIMPIPLSETRRSVSEIVASRDYTALVEYMEAEVDLTKSGLECCGTLESSLAIEQFDYLNSAIKPWVFDDSDPKIVAMRAKYADYSPAIVGVSQNNYVVVFGLSKSNQIAKILLSLEYSTPGY